MGSSVSIKSIYLTLAGIAVIAAASLGSTPCRANTLSAIGGLGFGRNSGLNDLKSPPPLLGADYMFDLSGHFEFGGFYQQNFLTYRSGESGTIEDAGVEFRAHLFGLHSGPFADAQVGLAKRTQGDNTSVAKASGGAGIGYEVPLSSFMSVGPHVGVRMLPDSTTDAQLAPVVDGAVFLSFHI